LFAFGYLESVGQEVIDARYLFLLLIEREDDYEPIVIAKLHPIIQLHTVVGISGSKLLCCRMLPNPELGQ
jgi:hypothetical protein